MEYACSPGSLSRIFPQMFSLASAHEAFNEEGELHDEKLQSRLNHQLAGYVKFCQILKEF